MATHSYTAEDEDELAFEKGAIIHVIKFEDPEEQVFFFQFLAAIVLKTPTLILH